LLINPDDKGHKMTAKKTILIVDDQESIVTALKRMLESEHYSIISALSGSAALELIANRRDEDDIFLIISDQRMPQMTGIQMLEETMVLLPDAIRVLMSGYADRETVTVALNQGIAHRFITKPWSMDELQIIVHQASEFPEKFRDVDLFTGMSENFDPNIMQKDIKKFNDYRNDMILGKIALHHGFITRRQLDASMTALQSARQAGRSVSLENILFEKELISSEDMGKLIAASRRATGKSFGAIAIKDYGAKPADVKRSLLIQAEEFRNTSICRLIGDILVAEKILTEDQKDSIIIDMTYAEREEILRTDGDPPSGQTENRKDAIENKIIFNIKKKNFFRQRAFDKLFCKIAINKNFVTESEVLQILEEQLADFGKNVKLKKIREIMISHGIISVAQADLIDNLVASKPGFSEKQSREGKKTVTNIGGGFELTVSTDEMEAKIKLIAPMAEDMTADYLKYLLKTRQVIYGLADHIDIEVFLRRAATNKTKIFTIAKGRPVKEGRNASIKYFFEDENARVGRELASGQFDYRARGEIVSVTPGTILAQKIPLIPAVKGSTVTGVEIPAPVPVDLKLSCGKGAALSKDGLTVTAEIHGRPDLDLGGKVSVMHEKTVEGNVDFRTGNIVFNGDITVHGAILVGFNVTGDNLTANDIEEAEVNIANNIIVKNNITNGNIKTGGNLLVAQIMTHSTVFARGDVIIQKEIVDCTITTSGKVMVTKGRIVASTIHAARGIEAREIGGEKSSPCNLFPGSDDHANTVINRFNEQIDSEKKRLEELEVVHKECEKKIFEQLNDLTDMSKIQESLLAEKESALAERKISASDIVRDHISDRIGDIDKNISKTDEIVNRLFHEHENSRSREKSIQMKIKALSNQIHEIIKERDEFQKWYEDQKKGGGKQGPPGVVVHGLLFAGTQIKATNCAMKVKEDIRNVKICQSLNNENSNNPFYEMKIDPLSSRRR